MSKDPRVYLAQILERIERIVQYSAAGRDAFFADSMIQDAIIRNLEVIGEASKHIPDEYRHAHPHVPWRSLAALRDVLIHQYEGSVAGSLGCCGESSAGLTVGDRSPPAASGLTGAGAGR